MGFNSDCPCTVVLGNPVNNTPVPLNAVDTIASGIVEGLFHSFNMVYGSNDCILMDLCPQGGSKTNSTVELGF